MKNIIFACFLFAFTACKVGQQPKTDFINILEWEEFFPENSVAGTVLIYDLNTDTYYSNNFERAREGFLPASTFKIFNTLAALETEVLDLNHVFYWDGEKKPLAQWERDMTLAEAFKYSCVPCYQEIARLVGVESMNTLLRQAGYGHMDVDETNIDLFWLEGNSRISPMEQINFLVKFHAENLNGFSSNTIQKVKQIMVYEKTDRYTLSAKTGWAIRQGNNTGWFVGYVEKDQNVYFFATNVEPTRDTREFNFAEARVKISYQTLRQLGLL